MYIYARRLNMSGVNHHTPSGPNKRAPVGTKRPSIRSLAQEEWEAFRHALLNEADAHDRDTAFGPDNYNVHKGLEYTLHIYQCGREHVLPAEWEESYDIFKLRQTREWKLYQELKAKYEDKQYMGLSDVLGESVTAVLMGDLTNPPQSVFEPDAPKTPKTPDPRAKKRSKTRK